MLRAWRVSLLALAAFIIAGQMSGASSGLRVDEAATLMRIHPDRAEVWLAVINSLNRPVKARVRFELVNQLNRTTARTEIDTLLEHGSNKVATELPLTLSTATRYAVWNRLRYYITSSPGIGVAGHQVSGTISVSQICPDIFDLAVIKPLMTMPGARYRVRVFAQNPVTKRSMEDVEVQAEVGFAGLPAPLTRSGITDAEGYAVFDFDIPQGASKATARSKSAALEAACPHRPKAPSESTARFGSPSAPTRGSINPGKRCTAEP